MLIFENEKLNIHRLVVGELSTNCYLLTEKKSRQTLIIDPADAADFIVSEISRLGLKPLAEVVTHGHFDHNLAALDLQLAYKIPYLIHEKDEFLLKNLTSSANYFLATHEQYLPPKIDGNIKKNLELGNLTIEVIPTPGHTPGSICLYSKNNKFLLSGDTLFKDGIGRTDFSYSVEKELVQSLKTLISLPQDCLVLPGHGEETTLKRERINLEYTLK